MMTDTQITYSESETLPFLSVVNQCANEILSKIKQKDIYSVILNSIFRIMNKPCLALILILDQNEQALRIAESRGFPVDFITNFHLKVGMGVSGKVAERGERMIITDVLSCQDFFYQDLARELNLSTMVSIPLMLLNKVVGVIDIFLIKPHRFSAAEIQLLDLITDFATIAIQNANSYKNIKRSTIDLDTIAHIARDIKSNLDLNAILRKILTSALGIVHTDLGFIYYQDYFSQKWHCLYPPGINRVRLNLLKQALSHGILGTAMHTRRAIIANDTLNDKNYQVIWPEVQAKMTVPVIIGDQVRALMDVESRIPFVFHQREEKLMHIMAEGIAIAYQSHQILKIAEKKTQEVIKLNSISEAIGAHKSLDEILDLIANQSLDIVGRGNKMAFVLIKDDARDTLVIKAACGEEFARSFLDRSFPIESQSMVTWVCRTGKYRLSPNVKKDPEYLEIHPQIQSELCIPLFANREVIGVIDIESTEPDAFNEADVELLRTLADNAAVATKVGELYDIRLKQLEALNKISNKINSSLNLQDVLNAIAREALRAIGRRNRVVYVQLINEDTDQLETKAAAGNFASQKYLGSVLDKNQGISGHVIRQQKYYLCSNVEDESYYVQIDPRVKSELCVPILFGGKVIGTINAESMLVNDFSVHEVELLNGLASQAGIAINNANLNEMITNTQFELGKLTEIAIVGEVLAGVSHDIRSNYSLIAGEAQWISRQIKKDKLVPHEILDSMEKIQSYVKLVEKLTQDLSIPSHKIPVKFSRNNIDDVIRQTVMLMLSLARRHRIKIIVYHKSLRFEADIDENRLKRTFINVIMNAIEAMPEGGRIRIEGVEESDYFKIIITDSGRGIPQEILDKVCQRFFSTKNSFGLGLAICKNIVENDHRGKFFINSSSGQGTQIILQLPFFQK